MEKENQEEQERLKKQAELIEEEKQKKLLFISTTKLVSSKTSRHAATSGVSFSSIFPPGRFQPHFLSFTNNNSPFSF